MRNHLFILFAMFVVFSAKAQNDTVLFSVKGGFYENVFPLELHNTNPQYHIRYTTNGNRPTAASARYEAPLLMDESQYSNSDIYTIVNCPQPDFFLPDSILHCIVIRAAVFDQNDSCVSQVATYSYFINALGCPTFGLPAVSLCADSLDLFDYERGIFVPGINFNSSNPYLSGNYFMKGREWERLCNFEFYEVDDNAGVNQQVGLRTHGKQSRWRSNKGYCLYAREEYGKKRIKYKFFDTTPVEKFKRLTLRPFSSTWNGAGCQDYLCNLIAQPLNVETLSSRPCVLFINGEYWGVYYVEEKPDEHYLEDHLGVDDDGVTIIKEWNEVDCGNPDNFNALYAWMEQADLTDEEQYAYVEAHIDIANFIDYYIFELYSANRDWPATNIRMWQEGDGKWRWILYDTDGCLAGEGFDAFANATYVGPNSWPTSTRATLFFRKMLENEDFKVRFASRFNELALTIFSYQRVKPFYDHIYQVLQPTILAQIERFNFPHTYSSWEGYCMWVIDTFLRTRPERIIAELNEYLSVGEPSLTEVYCYPNPFSEEIRLAWQLDAGKVDEVAVYDVLGRKVFSEAVNMEYGNEITIRPNLPAGIYLLKVGGSTRRIVRL